MDPLLSFMLKRYTHMAMHPGWTDYVRHEVRVFARDHQWIWGRLPQLLEDELLKAREEQRRANAAK